MKRISLLTLKLTLLLLVLIVTNQGLGTHFQSIIDERRWVTLVIFSAIWLCALAAVFAAAFHPSLPVRLAWAIPLSVAGTAAFGYYQVQGAEFFIFDVLNFWTSRHEAGRALEFYSNAIAPSIAVFCASIAAIVMPSGISYRPNQRVRLASGFLPLLPIVLIALVVLYREGKGSYSMPKQFSPISLAALAAYKLGVGSFGSRDEVQIKPGAPLVRALVMMVDESVRSDFISLEPGNPHTPEWAAEADRWIDFGPAVSGANCSHISNAILRFMAERRHLVRSVITSPTVWQYAKAAGFRTVFIDAQAGFIKANGRLQNYMTPAETEWIDKLYKLEPSIPTYQLDDELMRITLDELARGDRVFIYANKNGSHFPYENDAPGNKERTLGDDGIVGDVEATLQSYAEAVQWSTDRTMAQLTRDAPWDGMTVIYTSDHGQNFSPGRVTHCSSLTNVDAQEGIVPLMVATDDDSLKSRFTDVAQRFPGHGSHFAIAPTLLELMGYAPPDIAQIYDGSLLSNLSIKPQFASDDIFGLFSIQPAWHDADPFTQRRGTDLPATASVTKAGD
jgi:glucan phosphoethanolaminetransferase (alkaline phosphatase superfamily)